MKWGPFFLAMGIAYILGWLLRKQSLVIRIGLVAIVSAIAVIIIYML